MNKLIFITITLLISLSNLTKAEIECEDGELLPHNTDCGRYYQCKLLNNGIMALGEFYCNEGTLFDAPSKNCVPAEMANCELKPFDNMAESREWESDMINN